MQTLETARALLEHGFEVQVLCLFDWDPKVRRLFEESGAAVECLECPNRRNLPAVLIRLSRRLRALKPHVVHVQYIAPGLLSVLAARLAGVRRVLITVHQVGAVCTWFEHLLFRTATRLADITICVSRAVEHSWFERNGVTWKVLPKPGPRMVIYNCAGAELDPGRTPRARSGIFTIGYVGRIRAEKGVDVLVRAAAKLAAQGLEFRIVVAGDGPQRAECENLARHLGVAQRFDWLGTVERQQLPELYRSFDVVAVPSRWEGFGLVAAEAMLHGAPVVAARTGGLPEIIEDGATGLLFEPGDEAGLATALRRIQEDPVLAANCAARAGARAARWFSPAAYRAQLACCYDSFGVDAA